MAESRSKQVAVWKKKRKDILQNMSEEDLEIVRVHRLTTLIEMSNLKDWMWSHKGSDTDSSEPTELAYVQSLSGEVILVLRVLVSVEYMIPPYKNCVQGYPMYDNTPREHALFIRKRNGTRYLHPTCKDMQVEILRMCAQIHEYQPKDITVQILHRSFYVLRTFLVPVVMIILLRLV
jgi:hypothetical protein